MGLNSQKGKSRYKDLTGRKFGRLTVISFAGHIEPIMAFDLPELVELIKRCNPVQVNIGADSGHNHLPEPSREQVLALIAELENFTIVKQKSNLARLLK